MCLFAAAGYNGKEEQADLWKFDLKSRSWSRVQPLGDAPKARSVTDLVLLPDYCKSPTSRAQ